MRYYPVYLDLRERPCVIVGGGQVAERKALSLLEAGADVTVVSPTLTRKLQDLSLSGKISHTSKKIRRHRTSPAAFLVIAATDSSGSEQRDRQALQEAAGAGERRRAAGREQLHRPFRG